MSFVILNKSTLVSDLDVSLMAQACDHQVRYHAGPLHGRTRRAVTFSTDDTIAPSPGVQVIAILDDPDQANALGWHTEDQGDIVYGEVFARPVLTHGGDSLTKALSVASVLSHEVLEAFCDPSVNIWADNLNGTAYAYEVGDPVESDSYPINVTAPSGAVVAVTVSNFVTARWFDPQAALTERFDWMYRVTRPFQMTKGGYVVTMVDGQIAQKYGEHFPEWRKHHKHRPGAHRRTTQRH